MRRACCLFLIAVFILSVGTLVWAEEKPKQVTIGYLSLVNGQLITKNQKYHEKEMGVPIKWVMFDSGRDVNTAMASGSLDFGNVGLPPTTIGIAGGLNYWGILNANIIGAVESLAVHPDIKSLKDLEGKTVTAPFGSNTHYLLLAALNEAKVDLNKVRVMDMAPGEAVAAYMRGDIDAAYIWEPNLGRMVSYGAKILLTSEEMGSRGSLTWDVITVQPAFAKKYPELVKKFIKSELRAIDFWKEKPEEAAQIVTKELEGINIEEAKRMMRGTKLLDISEQQSPLYLGTSERKGKTADDIVAVSQFLLGQGRIKNAVSLKTAQDFLHLEYLEAVRAENN